MLIPILASSLLLVLSFPPWELYPFAWIALVPYVSLLERLSRTQASYKKVFALGLALSFGMTLGGFYWVGYVLHQFAGLPWIVSGLGLSLFGLICQPQFPLASVALVYALRRTHRDPGTKYHAPSLIFWITCAAAYTAVDFALPKLFVDSLGHSLHRAQGLKQIAEYGGVAPLTFLLVLGNLLFAHAWSTFRRLRGPSLLPLLRQNAPALGGLAAVVSVFHFWGIYRAEILKQRHITDRVQISAIQANIGDFDKVAAETGVRGAANRILDTFFDLSRQALGRTPKPDLLVWPETAYPSTFRTPHTAEDLHRDQRVERFVRENSLPLAFGGYDRADRKEYNAFFFLSPESGTGFPTYPSEGRLTTYRKNILLPFGETIPFYDQIRFLQTQFPQVGNFGRGVGPEVIELALDRKSLRVGPVICYEILYSTFVREAALKGSQLILNITNDSWFGPWGEPQLHLALSTFRSIETRLPIFRATNTGISAMVSPWGEIMKESTLGQVEIFSAEIPLYDAQDGVTPTFYVKWGRWFEALCWFWVIGVCLVNDPRLRRWSAIARS